MSKEKRLQKKLTRQERRQLRRKKRRRRVLVLVAELIILTVLGVVAYGMFKLDKLDFNILDQQNLDVYKDTGPYTNIALFGLDSREGELEGGVQSDTIMIASINNETNDVKLVSVYRDTLLQQADGTYEKANSAYNTGGVEAAISLLNRNLDLDIRNYVSVNFNALVDVIDLLGGLEIEMTQEEAFWCNGYAFETSQVTGKEMSQIPEEAGTQLLDGIHAVGYARIRYTSGDDFKRTERQRIVLEKVAEKAKQADFTTLNRIVDQVFPQISTSFSSTELLGFAAHAMNYNFVDTTGFPFDVTTSENVMNHTGSYVVPIDFSSNVSRLHEFLFDDAEYTPSETVEQVDNDIIYLTGVEAGEPAVQSDFTESEETGDEQEE